MRPPSRWTNPFARAAAPAAAALLLALFFHVRPAAAYPEFQAYSQKHSGRIVNCGMCHVNPDGPHGLKPGQIGALTPAELKRLNQARKAFDPGRKVDSPILNRFGDHIIETIGRRRFIQLRQNPAGLAPALGTKSDLDGDGIPDSREFLEGTDPLDAQSGAPLALFLHNLYRYRIHVILLFVATLLGLFGLNHLSAWFSSLVESREENDGVESGGDERPSLKIPARDRTE